MDPKLSLRRVPTHTDPFSFLATLNIAVGNVQNPVVLIPEHGGGGGAKKTLKHYRRNTTSAPYLTKLRKSTAAFFPITAMGNMGEQPIDFR